jgi:hypothetical protein
MIEEFNKEKFKEFHKKSSYEDSIEIYCSEYYII